MKILVTGCNGLLGHKLLDLLSARKDVDLIATARQATDRQGITFELLDIADQEQVNRVVGDARPDVIINGAAMTQVDPCETDHDACWKANVTGVQNLIDVCGRHNIHLVHVSTDFVFDGSREMLTEEDEPGPVNFYGKSKLEAEKLLQQSQIGWSVIRTVLVYGITSDMSRSNIVVWVKKSLEAGKTIQVVDDQFRTPTLAEDLAMACFLAAAQKAPGLYHISGKDYMSVFQIAQRTAKYFGLNASLIKPVPSASFVQPGTRPLKTGFIIEKARSVLGYSPRSFEEGLAIVAAQIKITETV